MMKLPVAIWISLVLLSLSTCAKQNLTLPLQPCNPDAEPNHSINGAAISKMMEQIVEAGVPGITLRVEGQQDTFAHSVGLAKIEDSIPLQSCHLLYLQSITKTYQAVSILQLVEDDRLDLDQTIDRYLDQKLNTSLPATDQITVRMLLNHTSGLPEYNFDPDYVSSLLQQPTHEFDTDDYLGFLDGKPLEFDPGSGYGYRNTNYVLLALIADRITGDHAKFMAQGIFEALDLKTTFYRQDPEYPNYDLLVNGYWDRYGDGVLENVSAMQRINVASLIGDDGIVATATDAVRFLQSLFEGELLSPAILKEMLDFIPGEDGSPQYGLGLDHTLLGGQVGLGHSGGGLGAGCQLHYFEEEQLFVFMGINLGTVTGGPIHKKAEPLVEALYQLILDQ